MDQQQSSKSVGSFLAAAQVILAEAGEPLRPREISERALAAGLVQTVGKTPEATMAAQLYTNINKHGDRSAFVKVGKGRFGLRARSGDESPPAVPPPLQVVVTAPPEPPSALLPATPPIAALKTEPAAPVVLLAQDLAERVVAELLVAQRESFDAVRFEVALTAAFAELGFVARHIGGPGQTDILLDAPITGAPYRVVVDAKSNKNGKVSDGSIDWNSLADHQKAVQADHILVVAPGFSGGNLTKRADDYGVTLATAEEIAELVRLHRDAPFSLLDLRGLFLASGRAIPAVEQLRQVAAATRARWRLLREIVDLVAELPAGAYPDTQNLWLLLSYRRKQSAPTLDDVADAVAVLASRALGILRPSNGSYVLTMQADTARRRLQALVRTVTDPPSSAAQAGSAGVMP